MRVRLWATAMLAAGLLVAAAPNTAQAALVDLGDGTVKDTATSLIWLQDWNSNGEKDWGTQMAWAAGLTFAGSDLWVLPTIDQYATLWADVGCVVGSPCNGIGDGLGNRGFTNVQQAAYWSSTEIAGNNALKFNAFSGLPSNDDKSVLRFAVAVRSGDVAAAPEPATLALLGLGLAGLAASRRRRQ